MPRKLALKNKRGKQTINFIVKELLFNGHLQSIGAAGLIFLTYFLFLKRSLPITLWVIVYLIFQSIFWFDRFRDFNKDSNTNKERSFHLSRYISKVPFILAGTVVLLSFLMFYVSNFYVFLFGFSILVLGFLYPIYFKSITKKIPLFKNIYVSAVYSLLPLYPFVFEKSINFKEYKGLIIIWILMIFFESMFSQVVLDFKDLETDRDSGLKTGPAFWGKVRVLNILNVFEYLLPVFFIAISLYLKLNTIFILLVLFSVIVNYQTLDKLKRNSVYAYILGAAKFSIWFVSFLIVKIII